MRAEDLRCGSHPLNATEYVCSGCGARICSDCVAEAGGRLRCRSCSGKGPTPESRLRGKGEAVASAGIAGGPVAARVVARCAFHPGARAVTRCSRCGALLCSSCQRLEGEKRYCEHCFGVVAERRAGPAGSLVRVGRTMGGFRAPVPWRLWPGLAFLPVPFALSVLMTYMMRQGEEVSVGAAQLLISILLYSTTLGFAFLVVNPHGEMWKRLGMHTANLSAALGLGIIGGSLTFWAVTASGLLSKGLLERVGWLEEWLRGFFDVNVKNATGLDLLVAGLVIIVVAPVCEEIFFRGFLYPAMRRNMGLWAAALLNGLLFSFVHFSLFGLLGRTLAGALFCVLYEYTDNLWSPVAAHLLNNFVAFFLPLAAIWSS